MDVEMEMGRERMKERKSREEGTSSARVERMRSICIIFCLGKVRGAR